MEQAAGKRPEDELIKNIISDPHLLDLYRDSIIGELGDPTMPKLPFKFSPTASRSSAMPSGGRRRESTTHTKEDKIEILSKITKAWLQMPDSYGLLQAIKDATAMVDLNYISDKDLARLLEEHVESSKKIEFYKRFSEAYDKLVAKISGNGSAPSKDGEDLMRRFIELVND